MKENVTTFGAKVSIYRLLRMVAHQNADNFTDGNLPTYDVHHHFGFQLNFNSALRVHFGIR